MKKHILFVDDEPSILTGLKRSLRSMRKEWELSFASNGQEALERLSESAFDAVVSDMRMPGMDGAQLLNEVRKRHPGVIRIVLSGHSESNLILSSVKSSHRYLAKPCNTDYLRETLTHVFALQQEIRCPDLRQYTTGLQTLPAASENIGALKATLASEHPALETVSTHIRNDPAMTAKVLQLASSSYFGVGHETRNADDAVHTLGAATIAELVKDNSLVCSLQDNPVSQRHADKVAAHCLKVAQLARKICQLEKTSIVDAEYAFTGGLLHDVGDLIVTHKRDTAGLSAPLDEDDHAAVGAYLLGLWGISGTIFETVKYHHHPTPEHLSTFSPITSVYLADKMSHSSEEAEVENSSLAEKLFTAAQTPHSSHSDEPSKTTPKDAVLEQSEL